MIMDYEKKYKDLIEAVKILQEAWHDMSKDPDNKTELKDFPSFDEAQGTPLLMKKDKPNPASNEEDELNFRRALWYVNYYQTHEADTKEAKDCFDFLESLKDRVQPKQEWSEEDERIYQSIMDDTVQENQLNGKQTNWLRDIKYRYFPQPKQKWSDEDKKHIMSIKSTIEHCKIQYPDASVVVEAYNSDLIWLSRLQPQWKPTKKQIMALRWVLNHIPYDIHKEEISGLFDQIKDL